MISRAPALTLCLFLGCATAVLGQNSADRAQANKAWQELLALSQLPQPPESWSTREPTEEEIEKFRASELTRLLKAADQAKEFQTKFPQDDRKEEAQTKEAELLSVVMQLGQTNVMARLDALDEARLKNTKLSEEERFQIRANALNRKAMSRLPEGRVVALGELENGARLLLKEFPKRTEAYEMLQMVALGVDSEKGAKLAKELLESPAAPDQVKDAVKPLTLLGKPLDIKFTAVDKRVVDLAKLRGKVVLVDFWATWCGPCVQEVPTVRAAYQKLHPKGFEIVGISFDKSRSDLLSFIKEHRMTWPQYFDGKYWENDFGKKFGIQGIPAMWLVDKKGNLRDLNARENLADKVEKLLAEKL